MKYFIPTALCAVLLLSAAAADAGIIGNACKQSRRAPSQPGLCSCIDAIARQSLNRSEQRRAAKFFKNPQLAQDTRQSDRRSDEAFWKRYKAFGQRAAKLCLR